MSRLERDNAELRNRLAETTATAAISSVHLNASQYTGHVTPAFHGIATPPEMGCIYDGGGHKKKFKKDKEKKKKMHDSSNSSSSSIETSTKDLLNMLKKLSESKKEKDEGTDEEEKRGRTRAPKEAEKVVFPKFPQLETYRNWRLRVRGAVVATSSRPDESFEWLSEVWKQTTTEEMLGDPGRVHNS